jgi:hypothetical protein
MNRAGEHGRMIGDSETRQGAGRVLAGEWMMLFAGAVLLLARCVLESRSRPLWCDEAFTAFAVSDPSFVHMLDALRDEINAMPPLSFVLGWGIARVIGVSDLALRLPSAVFTWGAMLILWMCLRRCVNRWVAVWCAVCLPLAQFTVLRNSTEARCYALYFAAYVAAVALYLRCAEGGGAARRDGWWVTIVHGTLVAVHYVGGLLSALLVVTALVASVLWADGRYRRYALQGAMGWLAVIPSLPFYLAQRKMAGDNAWLARPGLTELIEQFVAGMGRLPLLLITALVFLVLVAEVSRGDRDIRPRAAPAVSRGLVLLIVTGLMFVLAAWVESRLASNIFHDRYLFPLCVTWMIAIAIIADGVVGRLWEPRTEPTASPGRGIACLQYRYGGRTMVLVTTAVLSLYVALKTLTPREPTVVEVEALNVMRNHPGVPVVTSGGHLYVELGWYRRDDGNVVWLVADDDNRSVRSQRGTTAMERHYMPNSRKSLPECLDAFDSFLSVNPKPEIKNVEEFVAKQPSWQSMTLGSHTILLQRRAEDSGE